MNKKQLQKIINDCQEELELINFHLHRLEIEKRSLKSRQKIVKRKIIILNEKINKCPTDTINWSCTDFDDLDIL